MSYKKLWGHRTPLGAASRFCRLPRSLAEEEKEETAAAAAASLSCLSICYLPSSSEMLLCWLGWLSQGEILRRYFPFQAECRGGMSTRREGTNRVQRANNTQRVDGGRPLRKIWDGTDVIPSETFCEEHHEMIT